MKLVRYFGILFTIIAFAIFFNSCDGKYSSDPNDNIKLSTRNVNFSHTEGSSVISTENDGWAINYSKVKDEYLVPHPFNPYSECYTISGDWFTVEKVNNHCIKVSVRQNESGQDRECEVVMQSGNYFDTFCIKQEGKKS